MTALALVPIEVSHGFWPTKFRAFFAPGSTSHEGMTEEVILSLDKEFFGVTSPTKSMREAAREIAKANAATDNDPKSPPWLHFDREAFAASQSHLSSSADLIVTSLRNNDSGAARFFLGKALHTLQDFYSHSTWVELSNSTPCSSLVPPFPQFPIAIPALKEPTCDGPNSDFDFKTHKLTSGYFYESGAPEIFEKNIHGGLLIDKLDPSIYCAGINKDSTIGLFSPHWRLHNTAVNLAKQSTAEFIRGIRDRLNELGPTEGRKKLQLLFGDTLTITGFDPFLIFVKLDRNLYGGSLLDTNVFVFSGSSTSFSLPELSDGDYKLDVQGYTGGLSVNSGAFRITLPSNLEFTEVRSWYCPTQDWSKPHDCIWYTTPLSGREHYDMFYLFPWSSPYFHQENIYTVRTVTALKPQGPSPADTLSNVVQLLSVSDTLSGVSKTYLVPVDSTMSSLTVSLNAIGGTNSAVLSRPDSSIVQYGDPGVTIITNGGGVLCTIGSPAAGNWSTVINGSNSYALNVSGYSTLDFLGFEFARLEGRGGHQGYFAIPGQPIAGQTNTAHATLTPGFSTAQFEFRSPNGAPLQNFTLARGSDEATNEFLGDILLPSSSFLVYVTGTDLNGKPYQRLALGLKQVQVVMVEPPPAQNLYPGKANAFVFRVRNIGTNDSFQFSAFSDPYYTSTVTPNWFNLASNQAADVTVVLEVPTNAPVASSVGLTLTAGSTNNPSNFNFVKVFNIVSARALLQVTNSGGSITLSWTGLGTLQAAGEVSGPWTDLTNAFSPFTVQTGDTKEFYRVKQ